MVSKNGKHKWVEFVDLGEGHDLMSNLAGIFAVAFRRHTRVTRLNDYICMSIGRPILLKYMREMRQTLVGFRIYKCACTRVSH